MVGGKTIHEFSGYRILSCGQWFAFVDWAEEVGFDRPVLNLY
jgi:hypothetical protein